MRWLSDSERIFKAADNLTDSGPRDGISAWVYGVVLAAAPLFYGIWCIATGSALFIGGYLLHIVRYTGVNATAIGVIYISVACFVHSHFFWSGHEKYSGIGDIGKGLSLLGIVGGIGYLIVNVIILS